MNLYLIRHGQTSFSRENRLCGTSDPALTDAGEAMPDAFADAYASVPWEAIYTSPMIRARQTADPLERLTGASWRGGRRRMRTGRTMWHLSEALRNQEGT